MTGQAPEIEKAVQFLRLQEAFASIREATIRAEAETVARYRRPEAERVIRAVVTRNKDLGGYLRQLVRLVRLAAFWSAPRPFLDFFWRHQAQVEPSLFYGMIASTAAKGRLPATAVRLVGGSRGTRSRFKEVLEFVEPPLGAVDPGTGAPVPFQLAFENLPPLAILLDILVNTLGVRALHDPDAADGADGLLAPVLREPLVADANDVARALQSAFAGWLANALESEHVTRQARAIEAYLGRVGALRAGVVDDDLIVRFWLEQAREEGAGLDAARSQPRGEGRGFRRYRLAARALVRYARALRFARSEVEATDDAVSMGGRVKAAATLDALERAVGALAAGDADAEGEQESPGGPTTEWHSPLLELFAPPCDAVTWLYKKQLRLLATGLHGAEAAENGRSGRVGASEGGVPFGDGAARQTALLTYLRMTADEERDGALTGVDRFDPAFSGTLLRVEVFGAAQSTITDRLRHGGDAMSAIIRDALPPETSAGYALAERAFDELRGEVLATIRASIDHLVQRPERGLPRSAEPEGGRAPLLALLSSLPEGRPIVTSALGESSMRDAVRMGLAVFMGRLERLIRERLRSARAGTSGDAALDAFARTLRAAANRRRGFKAEEWTDPVIRSAHDQAAPMLVRLLREIEFLRDGIASYNRAHPAAFEQDRAIFAASFEEIYGRHDRTSPRDSSIVGGH